MFYTRVYIYMIIFQYGKNRIACDMYACLINQLLLQDCCCRRAENIHPLKEGLERKAGIDPLWSFLADKQVLVEIRVIHNADLCG